MNATRPAVQPAPTAAVEYRTLIGAVLAELRVLEPLIVELITTHQASRGFLSVEAARIQNEQIAVERWQRRAANQAGMPASHGETAAPGSITAHSLTAEIHHELAQIILDTRRTLDAAGICLYPPAWVPLDIATLTTEVARVLAPVNHPSRLRAIHNRLEDLATRAKTLVDGNDREQLPEPCPYCGLATLVVYHQQGVIRCERDPHTKTHQPCICTDSTCGCHRNPYGWRCTDQACDCRTKKHLHRHEWQRARGHKRWGWYDLNDTQNRTTWDQT